MKINQIVLTLFVLALMCGTSIASVESVNVRVDRYGMEAADWLFITFIIGALMQHFARFQQKKKEDPTLVYDSMYLVTTLASVLSIGIMIYETPVAQLTVPSLVSAFVFGLTGNEVMGKIRSAIKN